MSTTERGAFASKLGVILASAGSAVGLGNIWRFPTEVGRNGGAAFILVYLCFVFFLAMPVMVSEFVIGRSSRTNTVDAYRTLAPGKPWIVAGFMGILGGVLVLSFYSVVAGWTMFYTQESLLNNLWVDQNFGALFQDFVSNPWKPVLYQFLFLFVTHYIVSRGIESGIERFSKLMMPVLLILLVVLVGISLTMPGAGAGLDFLLRPDFSKLSTSAVLSAMGQAFFSLSVGIGCQATYASYFDKNTPLVRSAFSVCCIDSFVAILSGLVIFPAVFSVAGMSPDAGPGLVFITLPHVFNTAFASVPVFGYIFSLMFYVLLLLAALTSSISMHEICTAYIHETFKLSRKRAAMIVTGICLLLGVACSLSFGLWKDFTVMGMGFFALFDFLTAKFLMPLGGLLICTFVGWDMRHKLVAEELDTKALPVLMILFRWVAPMGIGIVFIYGLVSG